jgi:hypothetical protein
VSFKCLSKSANNVRLANNVSTRFDWRETLVEPGCWYTYLFAEQSLTRLRTVPEQWWQVTSLMPRAVYQREPCRIIWLHDEQNASQVDCCTDKQHDDSVQKEIASFTTARFLMFAQCMCIIHASAQCCFGMMALNPFVWGAIPWWRSWSTWLLHHSPCLHYSSHAIRGLATTTLACDVFTLCLLLWLSWFDRLTPIRRCWRCSLRSIGR